MIIRDHLRGLPVELWMAAERALGQTDDERKAMVGCVILRADGALVSARNGSSRGHKMFSAHAEARCVRKADANSVAYVARVRRDGSVGCAKPCYACAAKLRARGVREVFYTIEANVWGRMRLKDGSVSVWSERKS